MTEKFVGSLQRVFDGGLLPQVFPVDGGFSDFLAKCIASDSWN